MLRTRLCAAAYSRGKSLADFQFKLTHCSSDRRAWRTDRRAGLGTCRQKLDQTSCAVEPVVPGVLWLTHAATLVCIRQGCGQIETTLVQRAERPLLLLLIC